MNFKSKSKKWSIAECIEHATLAEIHFSEIIDEEMQKPSNPALRSKIKIKDEKIRPKMLSRLWKAKTLEVYKPSGRYTNPREAITAFHIERRKTIDYIKTTQDDLQNHFWKHRLTGTIDLYQTILLMSAHLERHIRISFFNVLHIYNVFILLVRFPVMYNRSINALLSCSLNCFN